MNDPDYIKTMRKEHPKHWLSMLKRKHPDIIKAVYDFNTKYGLCGTNSQLCYNYINDIKVNCEKSNRSKF